MKILQACLVAATTGVCRTWTILLVAGITQSACWAYPQETGRPTAANTPGPIQSAADTLDEAGNGTTDEKPDPAAYDDRSTQRLYEKLFRRLKQMKTQREKGDTSGDQNKETQTSTPSLAGEIWTDTSLDGRRFSDSFVIGTAAVNPQTQNADVCFRTVNGIDETAHVIIDSHSETIARGEISYWHVFYRVPSETNAQPLLAHLQSKYDEQVAYRQQLMRQYNARSIRRC